MGSLTMQFVSRTLTVAILLTVLTAAQSWAGGGQHYPNGVEDFAVGALPPPGTYLVNYLIYAHKNDIKNNSGNSAAPPSFRADVVAEVPRFIYVTPFTLFGANWAVHAFFPYYSADIQGGTNTPAAPGLPPRQNDLIDARDQGLGDIIFSPAIFGWHFGPNLHAVAALDIWAPTGDWNINRPATQIISKNIWTFEPVLAVSYFNHGFDLSAKLMYDFNTHNKDTDTTPGQEFHVDWALGYGFQNGINVGVAGYNYWQTTDDETAGADVVDQKSRIGGIGPAIKYWPKHGPFSMTLKHYWEYDARNIVSGQQTMFKIIYAF